MLCVLKTYVKIDGYENIYNLTLKIFVYLNRCSMHKAVQRAIECTVDVITRQHFQDKKHG